MTRGTLWILCVLFSAVIFGLPRAASAQTTAGDGPGLEANVTVGWGRVWRHRSGSARFGSGPNLGASVVVRAKSGLAFSVDVHRTFGVGSTPTAFSTNLRYYFRANDRVQPYVIAGLGMLAIDRRGLPANAGRADTVDIGFGPNLGAGLALVDNHVVAALPEVQWLEGSWRSPLNLSVTRIALGAGCLW